MIQFIYTGKLSSTALASLTGKCFLVCNSHCWPQQACLKRRAATLAIFSQFESQKLLPWLSSSFTKVSMLCKFWALTRIYILYVKMKFFGFRKNICHRLKPHYCFAQSFNLSLVSEYKQNIRTKPQVQNQILSRTADLNRQPVQEMSVCSDLFEKGSYFRWQSPGSVSKLTNDLRHELHMIATKACLQPKQLKMKAMSERHWHSSCNFQIVV